MGSETGAGAAHDPLYANSQRYEQALREIQTLVEAGALSAGRAAMAREQASSSLLTASVATDWGVPIVAKISINYGVIGTTRRTNQLYENQWVVMEMDHGN